MQRLDRSRARIRSGRCYALAMLALLCLMTLTPAASGRPNVLMVVVDDMRVELGCYGQSQVVSPNIDALAARGTRFDRAYCQQAVCNPSRASVLTGLRPDTLGVFDLETHFRDRRPDVVTLPQAFKAAGYRTRGIGKVFHNWHQPNRRGDARSWSEPAMLHYGNHGDDVPHVGVIPPNAADTPKLFRHDVPDEAYFDGRIARLAADAIEGYAADRDGDPEAAPFFLAVGFWKPHSPFNAPEKYWRLYDETAASDPVPAAAPSDVPKLAMHDSREIRRAFKSRPGRRPDAADTRALRTGYYAAISYVDAQIGRVLEALKRSGLEDDTIVVFWSDHGYHLGEHTLWAKTSNFELDARVPLIVARPGQQPAATDALVELVDLFPTLADLCGVAPPEGLEGVSLRPVLEDAGARVKDAAVTWHPRPAYVTPEQPPEAMGWSVRTEAARYTEWRDFQTDKLLAAELYDHGIDPLETENLAGRDDRADQVATLAGRLAEHRKRTQ